MPTICLEIVTCWWGGGFDIGHFWKPRNLGRAPVLSPSLMKEGGTFELFLGAWYGSVSRPDWNDCDEIIDQQVLGMEFCLA